MIDDYHLVEAPDVHRSMEFLLDHLPPALHVVLASRSDPPLPLARLRARGQLVELRAGDLRFTTEEAAELLRTEVGPHLPDPIVAALGDRTEGWAAGLHLAALSLQGRGDVTGSSPSSPAATASSRLPHRGGARAPARASCARSCWRPRSSTGCAAALRRGGRAPDGQQLLESVERASLFLIPLDEERRWWRYHHLFADLLRANLQPQHPHRVPELHRAAATGTPTTAFLTTPSGTPWQRATPHARPSSSRSTWRSRSGGAKPRATPAQSGSPASSAASRYRSSEKAGRPCAARAC